LLPKNIRIKAVGDIMLGTNFPNIRYLPPDSGKLLLSQVAPMLNNTDIVFGNLEGVLLDSGGIQKKCKNPKACYLFRSPTYMVSHLVEAGFNLLSVANNHAGDFGDIGRKNTSKVLDQNNIYFAGNSICPYTHFEKKGIRFGFVAFAPNKGTVNINDIDSAKKIVGQLDLVSDIVIVSMHAGAEGSNYTHITRKHEYFYGEDRGDVYHFAREMIDAGADLILGHGPHVPRAIDLYKDRLIVYSLGNFATYGRFNLKGSNGLTPILDLTLSQDGTFIEGKILPAHQLGRGIPSPDPGKKVIRLIKELSQHDVPESSLSIDEDGHILQINREP